MDPQAEFSFIKDALNVTFPEQGERYWTVRVCCRNKGRTVKVEFMYVSAAGLAYLVNAQRCEAVLIERVMYRGYRMKNVDSQLEDFMIE